MTAQGGMKHELATAQGGMKHELATAQAAKGGGA